MIFVKHYLTSLIDYFRSIAPLYPPGLDENGTIVNLYPASWIKQGHALKNGVEGVSDEAFYLWESPKKN